MVIFNEKSLLDAYRKLVLYRQQKTNSQHPLHSFYYAEFCRLENLQYNKGALKNVDESQFDVLAREIMAKNDGERFIGPIVSPLKASFSIQDVCFEKLIGALVIMEHYVRNIIAMPWKIEFQTILTYSGMYMVWIEPYLKNVEQFFSLFGYQKHEDENKYVLRKNLPKDELEQVAMTFRLAVIVCLIVYSTHKRFNSPDVPLILVFDQFLKNYGSELFLVPLIKKVISHTSDLDSRSSGVLLEAPTYNKQSIGKKDTGTQYDLPIDEGLMSEENASMYTNVRLRDKSLNLKSLNLFSQKFPDVSSHYLSQKDGKISASVEIEEDDYEDVRPKDYGFSHLIQKSSQKHLSPDLNLVLTNKESDDDIGCATYGGGESHTLSPLMVMGRSRMREDDENLRRMTFSTFKKHSPLNNEEMFLRDSSSVNLLHQTETSLSKVGDNLDMYLGGTDPVYTASNSESSLAAFQKTFLNMNEDSERAGFPSVSRKAKYKDPYC